jgi:predicted RNase H-like HicB family nuclease
MTPHTGASNRDTRATAVRTSVETYLALEYPFQVIADPDGGYVAIFPDLPGCMTQAESLAELATMAEDARRIWITTAFEHQMDIPLGPPCLILY